MTQELSDQKPTLRLEDVMTAFHEWRSGPRPRGCIPETLWDKVTTLLNDYPESKVRNSLGISKQQLHKKLNSRYDQTKKILPQTPAFVQTIANVACPCGKCA